MPRLSSPVAEVVRLRFEVSRLRRLDAISCRSRNWNDESALFSPTGPDDFCHMFPNRNLPFAICELGSLLSSVAADEIGSNESLSTEARSTCD